MDEPRWLERAVVDAMHADQLRRHGGLAGVRDENGLEAALARPRHKWAYEPACDLALLAAAYGYGIGTGHPYSDGNKRTAFLAMYVFLGLNDYELEASQPEVVTEMLAVADGRATEEQLAEWVRAHLR